MILYAPSSPPASTDQKGAPGYVAYPGASTISDWSARQQAQFLRILDHRSIVLADPMDALARLQLARALVLSGDAGKAKNAYDDLLMLWKNADADIPVIKTARQEYARLP